MESPSGANRAAPETSNPSLTKSGGGMGVGAEIFFLGASKRCGSSTPSLFTTAPQRQEGSEKGQHLAQLIHSIWGMEWGWDLDPKCHLRNVILRRH